MRKAKKLLGLQVISQRDGKDLGTVHDLLFTNDSGQLIALLVDPRDLFGLKDATAIAFSQGQRDRHPRRHGADRRG